MKLDVLPPMLTTSPIHVLSEPLMLRDCESAQCDTQPITPTSLPAGVRWKCRDWIERYPSPDVVRRAHCVITDPAVLAELGKLAEYGQERTHEWAWVLSVPAPEDVVGADPVRLRWRSDRAELTFGIHVYGEWPKQKNMTAKTAARMVSELVMAAARLVPALGVVQQGLGVFNGWITRELCAPSQEAERDAQRAMYQRRGGIKREWFDKHLPGFTSWEKEIEDIDHQIAGLQAQRGILAEELRKNMVRRLKAFVMDSQHPLIRLYATDILEVLNEPDAQRE
jgi:hypothetical protein